MNVLKSYLKAKAALFEHVGLTPDWVEYAVSDCSNYYWSCDGDEVFYADSMEEYESGHGNFYSDEVYEQRFYKKHIYKGESFTLIFCDPNVDGCKWFKVFDNALEVKK